MCLAHIWSWVALHPAAEVSVPADQQLTVDEHALKARHTRRTPPVGQGGGPNPPVLVSLRHEGPVLTEATLKC